MSLVACIAYLAYKKPKTEPNTTKEAIFEKTRSEVSAESVFAASKHVN